MIKEQSIKPQKIFEVILILLYLGDAPIIVELDISETRLRTRESIPYRAVKS